MSFEVQYRQGNTLAKRYTWMLWWMCSHDGKDKIKNEKSRKRQECRTGWIDDKMCKKDSQFVHVERLVRLSER